LTLSTLALAVFVFAPPDASPSCDGKVRGSVVDQSSAEPLPRVTIRVDGEQVATTDADGRFEVTSLCRGTYALVAERADYVASTRRWQSDGLTAGHVDFSVEPRTVDRLDDVVVVAPAAPSTTATGGTRLDGDALERTRGKNLADAIAQVPGVAVLRSNNGTLGKPIIRGQFGRRNLILFDRVRHESQKWGLDHAPEVDPYAAGAITVIKGPGALRYGGDAVGGVVLIDPRAWADGAGYGGEAHAVGFSNGRRGSVAARVDGVHAVGGLTDGRLAWRVEGNVTRGAALQTPDYPLDNTGMFNWNAGVRTGYLSAPLDLELSYRRHFMKTGLFTGLRAESLEDFEQALELGRPVGVENYEADYAIDRAFSQVAHDLAVARARVRSGHAGDVVVTYAFQHDDRSEWDVVRSAVRGPQLEFGLSTHQGQAVFEQAPVMLGARWSLQGAAGAEVSHQQNVFSSAQTLVPDYRHWRWGAFVTERFLGRRVDVELGGRYDGLDLTANLIERDYQGQLGANRLRAADCELDSQGDAACGRTFHAGSGSAALVGHVLEGFDLVLDASSTARFPAIDELYQNGEAPSFPAIGLGRSTLDPERTWATSLTARYATDWVATEASVYFNYIDDYIYFRPAPADGPLGVIQTITGPKLLFTFESVNAMFWGFDYGVDFRPDDWPVSFDSSVSLVRGQDTAGNFLVFVPADRFRLGTKLHWSKWVRARPRGGKPVEGGFVGINGQYVAQQFRSDPDADFAAPPPGYFLLGAEAGVAVPLARDRQRLEFAVVGQNLTNARYRDYTSLIRYFADEPGWELSLRVTWRWTALARK